MWWRRFPVRAWRWQERRTPAHAAASESRERCPDAVTAERFERRLAQEIGALRVDMAKASAALRIDLAKESGALRAEMAQEFATVRKEMQVGLAETHASLLKWSFLFWVGQFAAVSAMMAFLLKTIGTR